MDDILYRSAISWPMTTTGALLRNDESVEGALTDHEGILVMDDKIDPERLADIADRYDLQIFVHMFNDKEAVRGLLEKGVGVYTDRVE